MDNSIGLIDIGGCRYDVRSEVIIHDAGPMSNDNCPHRGNYNEAKLTKDIQNKFSREIDREKRLLAELKKDAEPINLKILKAIEEGVTELKIKDGAIYWSELEIPKEYRKYYNLCIKNKYYEAFSGNPEDEGVYLIKRPADINFPVRYA